MLHWGVGPQWLVADAYYPCATPVVCECPDDSPCKKDCCRDACTCKGKKEDKPACCAVAACTGTTCVAGSPVCVHAPCTAGGFCMPYAPAMMPPPRLHQVQMKIGDRNCPTMLLPAGGHVAHAEIQKSRHGGVRTVRLHLSECPDGYVEVEVNVHQLREGCGGHKQEDVYHGKKAVQPGTG